MSSDIGELLREGIDHATAGEQFHPSLTARARQRHRRRAMTIRAAALTGTAVVTAVAAFAATAGLRGTSQPGTLPARSSAYIFSHTEAALAAAGGGTLIMRVAYKLAPAFGPDEIEALGVGPKHHAYGIRMTSLPIVRTVSWRYHGLTRTQGYTASGRLSAEIGPSTATRPAGPQPPPAMIAVNPVTRTWYHPAIPPKDFQIRDVTCTNESVDWLAVADSDAHRLAGLISKALSCHLFRADGQQVVDGVLARRLTATPALMKQIHGNAGDVGNTATLWIDPRTYLPVRLALSHAEQTDFAWLKPTPANLALLQVKVPAGFRSVQLPVGAQILWLGTGTNK